MERRERDKLLSLSRRSITLINTQLIHQFAFRHADAVNLVLLRAGITLMVMTSIQKIYDYSCHPQGMAKWPLIQVAQNTRQTQRKQHFRAVFNLVS